MFDFTNKNFFAICQSSIDNELVAYISYVLILWLNLDCYFHWAYSVEANLFFSTILNLYWSNIGWWRNRNCFYTPFVGVPKKGFHSQSDCHSHSVIHAILAWIRPINTGHTNTNTNTSTTSQQRKNNIRNRFQCKACFRTANTPYQPSTIKSENFYCLEIVMPISLICAHTF